MKHLKAIFLNMIAGANIMTVVLMLVAGYSDHLSPIQFPRLCFMGMIFPLTVVVNLLFIPLWVFLSWRRLLITVVGFLLAFPPIRIYMPLHTRAKIPENALCVVSYNVCGYGGNYKYDQGFDTVFSYLKSKQPDIVCIQEDNDVKAQNALERMKQYFAYTDTVNVSNSKTKNCLGFYTRFPILWKEILPYESPTNGSVAYFLKVESDTVMVINNHLETSHLSANDRDRYQEMIEGGMQRDTAQAETFQLMGKLSEGMQIRASHAEIIHQYIKDHQQYPVILCGDFNDTPISYTRHTIAKGLNDCFVEAGRGMGFSFNRKGFNIRIDHMMCSDHFEPVVCEIDNKMDASDHYPLLCWLKMREK